jgi:DNA-binding response OmpR family regulator
MPIAMIVEDDEDLRRLFAVALEEVGFDLMTAGTARQAIKQLEAETPDVAFIDVSLPEFPGTDVLEYIKATPRLSDTKTIIVTGNIRASSRAEELGADLFMMKPVDIHEVIALAQRLMVS